MLEATEAERESSGIRRLEQLRSLDRALAKIRWFGAILGLYLVAQTNSGPPPHASRAAIVTGQVIIGFLLLGNAIITVSLRRARSERAIRTVGMAAFALDSIAVVGLVWTFSYTPTDTTWVVLYVLPLEGAVRYGLAGALGAMVVVAIDEVIREAYLAARLSGYWFVTSNVAFRVGIGTIIALVAGFMARSLTREARLFEEAAGREAAARREATAFNTVILAGAGATQLDESLKAMAEAISEEFGFEVCAIMLIEGDVLRTRGLHGLPESASGRAVRMGEGVAGTVAAGGSPLLVPDVSRFPGHVEMHPDVQTEFAAPLKVGDEVIGVLDVGSRLPAAVSEPTLDVLCRLADQIALVIHSDRLQAELLESYQALRKSDDERRRLLSHLVRAQEEERQRLAGDIHDDSLQKMVAVSMRLQLLVQYLRDPELLEVVDKLQETVNLSIARLRTLLFELRPPVLEAEGLAPALRLYVEHSEADFDLQIEDRLTRRPAAETRLLLYRIAQEALANVGKHAKASRVVTVLQEKDGGFLVRIQDDGVGFNPNEAVSAVTGHIGLTAMRERAEMAGGWCEVRSLRGGGTTVDFWIPARIRSSDPSNGRVPAPRDGRAARHRAGSSTLAGPGGRRTR